MSPQVKKDLSTHAAVWAGLVLTCWAAVVLLVPGEDAAAAETQSCWEWDREGHTLSIENTLDQFELAHDTYRRTGRAPDALTECKR
tara:strand:- start:368 stop:625 length:258 start_codon:yes stop_codon:yes gene_type:complete